LVGGTYEQRLWLTQLTHTRGSRFSYTYYYPEPPPSDTPAVSLSHSSLPPTLSSHPIHASISALDHEAMDLLTLPPSTASEAHDKFSQYLTRTKNTICGRHPIGVLFGALTAVEDTGLSPRVKWVRYEQSSQCVDLSDSSVSYASAYVVF
jgi:MEMO1 family protein